MNERYNVSLLESLEQLPTLQLDAMLRAELEKEIPDEHAVRSMLKVLRKRESDLPVFSNQQIDEALARFHKKTTKNPRSVNSPLVKAAAIIVLCSLLLFLLPQNAHAKSFFDRIGTWTENVFVLFSAWNPSTPKKEYVFRTNHPGLQELYDTVSELGVTAPVVPMRLDDGYLLDNCKISISPTTTKILGRFSSGEKQAIFELNIYADSIPRDFHKNEENVKTYERNNIVHYIFRNNELWTVVWTRDNLECSIFIECQEEVLYQILDSIYAMEE